MKEPELTTYWIVVYVSLPKALPIQDAEGSGIPPSAMWQDFRCV